MADTLTTVTTLINSPPGQVIAGATLAGTVWKAFEKWEAVASENDKVQVWIWLDNPRTADAFERWPETFARMFDRIFGSMPSWKSFFRSFLISTATILVVFVGLGFIEGDQHFGVSDLRMIPRLLVSNAVPDYVSLLISRRLIGLAQSHNRRGWWLIILLALGSSVLCAFAARAINDHVMTRLEMAYFGPATDFNSFVGNVVQTIVTDAVAFIAALFPSLWFWLYAGSGFLLKAARRLDIGFRWFSERLDVEKKPLQSIGLVAGALVALVYWAAVFVNRFA
jgi:hypothetical protein